MLSRKTTRVALAALALALSLGLSARADETLKAGDAAPDLAFKLDDGTTLQLSTVKKPVVIYFYPKDDTPGCTREACTYRDRSEELAATGALVVGVSFDDAASHKRFREKFKLAFALATDDGSLAKALGVTVRGIGPIKFHARDTIVVSADMKVVAVLRGVDPVESVEEVLKAIKAGGGAATPAPEAATGTATPK